MKSILFFSLIAFFLNAGNLSAQSTPFISLSDYYLHPGQIITVRGSGFSSLNRVILDVGGKEYLLASDSRGDLPAVRFVVAEKAVGRRLTISARDQNGANATADLVVSGYYPLITPSSYFVIPGGPVRFTGNYFAPGEEVLISTDNQELGLITANASGSFLTGDFTLPYQSGNYNYRFTGSTSGQSQTVRLTIGAASTPWILLSSYYAPPGTGLSVHGRGFGDSEVVRLYYDGNPITTLETSSSGEFEHFFRIPQSSLTKHVIEARGLYTGATAREQFNQAP